MKPFITASLTAGLLSGWAPLAINLGTDAQERRIAGAWRVVEVTRADEAGVRRTQPSQPGIYLFTARHYSITRVDSNKPRPDLPTERARTSDHYRESWGPFTAQAGTYEIKGERLITRPQVSKNPFRMERDAFSAYVLRTAGDTLWLQLVAVDDGPVRDSVLHKLVRAEP